MRTFDDLPEHILYEIVSVTIDSTKYRGWLFTLRLVNHQFNEAVLHVYYLRKRMLAVASDHSLDCINPCWKEFCSSHLNLQSKRFYAARFNFQSILAIQNLPPNAMRLGLLLRQWEAALTILRGLESLQHPDPDQVQSYSTCSSNPIFNDFHSAVLSDAISSYLGHYFPWFWIERGEDFRAFTEYESHSPDFWVALSTCVLGDIRLAETYIRKLSLPFEAFPPLNTSNLPTAKNSSALLHAAIVHAKLDLVRCLLERCPSIMSAFNPGHSLLRTAVGSNNNEVLKAVLQHTPPISSFLAKAMNWPKPLVTQSSSGSECIRLLARHFTPLCAEARAALILQSCAVGDVTLLEEFSEPGSLFSYRICDLYGLIPTYAHFAIRCGNIDTLRYLLNHGVIENRHPNRIRVLTEQALSFNQIECYREIYHRFDWFESELYFVSVAATENAESLIAEFIRKHGSLFLEPLGYKHDRQLTIAQLALGVAIQALRPGNIQFLLSEGVCEVPPLTEHARALRSRQSTNPFEIQWPHFNQNKDAFQRTQALLTAVGLPELKIIV